MSSAALDLQKAIVAALRGNAELVDALGGPRIYDAAPADVPFPYVTLGRSTVYDWSTATEEGSEHIVSLHVWSKARGKKEALLLMEIVGKGLNDAALALDENRLVLSVQEYSDMRFDEALLLHHGTMRLRAYVEAA